jgi:hypothetical protein
LRGVPMEIEVVPVPPPVAETTCQLLCGWLFGATTLIGLYIPPQACWGD